MVTIKHRRDRSPVDVSWKDSWPHARAGSYAVVVAGGAKLALFRPAERAQVLERIVREFLSDMDLLLTEGFKKGPVPKIEVNRAAQGLDLLRGPGDNLIAVVTDRGLVLEVPVFGLDAKEPLADFVAMRFLAACNRCRRI